MQEQIQVGDRFQSIDGRSPVWVVTVKRPFGVVEMVTEDRAMFTTRNMRDVRRMQRLDGRDQKAIRMAQYLSN